jgi:hypothetical protein
VVANIVPEIPSIKPLKCIQGARIMLHLWQEHCFIELVV